MIAIPFIAALVVASFLIALFYRTRAKTIDNDYTTGDESTPMEAS